MPKHCHIRAQAVVKPKMHNNGKENLYKIDRKKKIMSLKSSISEPQTIMHGNDFTVLA